MAFNNEKNPNRIVGNKAPLPDMKKCETMQTNKKNQPVLSKTIYEQNMTDMNQRKPLNYRFLTWDRHIYRV